MESTSYVLCFFYFVTKGWIFDISLCENSINRKKKYFFGRNIGGRQDIYMGFANTALE